MTILARLSAALADRYRIERELGQGGMATVHLAHDLRHERAVAIKVLHPDLAAALGAERFLAEIKTTARLQHPHILPLLDSGVADGLLYYVMPYVAGESLRDRLVREKQLPIEDAVRIAQEVADALGHAHAQGVVHRDIKPENILLQGGHALVADFGIALAVEQAGGERMTQTGLSLGTPSYMSPEQAMGERTLDARADVYALGAVTYEMLTGEPPFTGPTVQAIVAKVLSDRARPPSLVRDTVPPEIDAAVLRALAKLPADRFSTAAAFATALAAPIGRVPAGTTMSRAATRSDGRAARPWQILSAVLALAAVALAAALFTPRGRETEGVVRAELDIGLTNTLTLPSLATAPDGRSIVYCNGTEVWIRRWEDFSGTRVRDGNAGCFAAAFSPDGRQLAIMGVPNALRIVSLTGEAPPRLLDVEGLPDLPVHGGGLEWGSDGRIYIGSRSAILAVHPQDGASEVVARIDSLQNIRGLDVLPGARASLVVVAPRASSVLPDFRIAVVDHGSGETDYILQGVNARLAGTDHLIVARDDGALVAVPFDLGARRPRGTPIALGDSLRPDVPALAVTSRGTLVYWRSGASGVVEPVLVDRSGTVQDIAPGWNGVFLTPRLSADGSRLAVEEFTAGASEVWLRDLRSGQTRRLTVSGSTAGRPTWNPDGRSLTILSDRDGTSAAYVRRLDDASMKPLPRFDARALFHTEWSPDGRWLVLRTDDQAPGRGDILAARPGIDTVAIPITASPEFWEYSPSLSPDGQWLAYSSNESGRYEVWVTTFPEPRGKWQVSSAGGTEPLWSRSGRELFYITEGHLVAARITTSPAFAAEPPQRLFPIAPYAQYGPFNRNYDVMPDDRRFLMLRQNETSETRLVAVFNWRALLSR